MNTPQDRGGRRRERGAVSVELALMLAFLLVPLLAGVIDFGQILHAQSVVARAAREGAMAAARNQDVASAVEAYIRDSGYDYGLAHVSTQGSGAAGTPVTVTVSYDTSSMVIIPWGAVSPNITQVAAAATAPQL